MGGVSLTVLHVGKPRIGFVRSGIEHFSEKIRPHATLKMLPVREEPLRKGVSVQYVHKKEQGRLLKMMDPRCIWVVLHEKGRTFRSEELASLMENWIQEGKSRLGFLVGGPCGFGPAVLEEAHLALSVSSMTFSHEVTLLVLLEQLYRALAVMNRLPYPK